MPMRALAQNLIVQPLAVLNRMRQHYKSCWPDKVKPGKVEEEQVVNMYWYMYHL